MLSWGRGWATWGHLGSGTAEAAAPKGRGLLGAVRGMKQPTAAAAAALFRGWESRVLEFQGSSLDYSLLFQTAGVCPWKLPAPALPSAASEVGMTLAPHPGTLQNSIDRGLGPAHFGVPPFHCPVFPGLLPSQRSRSLWNCYIWASVEDRSSSHTQGDVP